MHFSHDFIATKTCPSYEFLVVFGQVRVSDRKSAGRARVGMVCRAEQVRVRSVRVRGGSGQNFSNSCGFKFWGCGAGADKKFQPAQDSSVQRNFWPLRNL